MQSSGVIVIYLFFSMSQFMGVICDGDHQHAHDHTAAGSAAATETSSTSSGPQGSVTTVHTTSADSGGGFASILSSLSPELIGSLASNPQIAQALRSSGVDVGTSTAAKAAAAAGGRVAGGGGGAYDYPPPPGGLGGLGGLAGLGGLGGFGGIPFFGPYKQLHVSGDFGGVYPFVEKAIIIVGGGILLLVILALLAKAVSKGGLFYNWGSSISEALAGSASVDLGPFHKSVAGSAAVNAGVGHNPSSPSNMQLTQRVYDGLDQRF